MVGKSARPVFRVARAVGLVTRRVPIAVRATLSRVARKGVEVVRHAVGQGARIARQPGQFGSLFA